MQASVSLPTNAHRALLLACQSYGAAKESNLPTAGLRRPAGFEDRMGHQARAAPRGRGVLERDDRRRRRLGAPAQQRAREHVGETAEGAELGVRLPSPPFATSTSHATMIAVSHTK